MFRSWHNLRAFDSAGPWQRFTLVMAYATESHMFINDPNQSPFNVGTQLLLEDFTLEQIASLNRRYRSPLGDDEAVARYFALVGGHPSLAHCALRAMASGQDWATLESRAIDDNSPFGGYLRRLLRLITRDETFCEAIRAVLLGRPCPTPDSFYQLRSAGIIVGSSPREAKLRSPLYAKYLSRHLL